MIYEYLVKGLSLGILGYLGWNADPKATALVYGLVLLGLVIALAIAWQRAKAAGVAPKSLSFSFVVYLLLEYPGLIYTDVLSGLLIGAGLVTFTLTQWTLTELGLALGIGLALGVILVGLRLIAQRNIRRAAVLALGVAAVG